jgi:hypothetical protein
MAASFQSRSPSDLEDGRAEKMIDVTVSSVRSETDIRPFGRRHASTSTGSAHQHSQLDLDKDDDTLNKVGNMFFKIQNSSIIVRYGLYIIPVAALLAIPLVITALKPELKTGGVELLGLFVWIEIVWCSLWICKLVAHSLPFVFHAVAGLVSGGVRKYSQVFVSLEVPVSLFLWTIVAFATAQSICSFDSSRCHWSNGWTDTLQTVFKAGIIVAAIFLAEKTLIQIIAVDYHRKQYDEKIRDAKRLVLILDHLYDASRALFPEFSREFEDEDADIQGNTLADMRTTLAKRGVNTKLLNNLGRARDKATAAFGAMASDIAGKQMFSATSAHAIVLEALESDRSSKALARRLWLSFVRTDAEVLYKQDLIDVLGPEHKDEVEEIFAHLDKDGNGDVSLDEMTMLVVNAAQDRKNRTNSMKDISHAISVLDRLLSIVVLIGECQYTPRRKVLS